MASFRVPFTKGNFGSPQLDSENHDDLADRLRKTLYYGQHPKTDRPSLPLTEAAVEFFHDAAPRKLGQLDTDFASRTGRQACVSPSSVMMGMLYTKRLKNRNPEYLQQITSSDLFLISMMMASKYLYDEGTDDEVFNDEWAASADLETEEINEMEINFLSAIDWQLFVHRQEFENVLYDIEKRIALRQGTTRGNFTYTDIWVLSHDPQLLLAWKQVAGEMSKVILVTGLAYVAGILTMVGSTILVTSAATCLPPLMSTAGSALLPIPQSPPNVHLLPGQTEVKQEKTTPLRMWSVGSVISQLLTIASIRSIQTMTRQGSGHESHDHRVQGNDTCKREDDQVSRAAPSLCTDQTCVFPSSFGASACSIGVTEQTESEMRGTTVRQTKDMKYSDPDASRTSSVISRLSLANALILTLQDFLTSFTHKLHPSGLWENKENEKMGGFTRKVCAKGPCLKNSNPTCQNVTMETDDSPYPCHWCTANWDSSFDHEQRNTWNSRSAGCKRSPLGPQGRDVRDHRCLNYAMATHCCCEEPMSSTVDRGGGYFDVSLGFHTQRTLVISV